jgi:hypothetical protein
MYRILKCTKDAYITSKFVANDGCFDSNTGMGGTLDLYKLYDSHSGGAPTGSTELSRVLLKFNLDPIRELTGTTLDITDPDFKCFVNLKDIYGGQPYPATQFSLTLLPLAIPFEEGKGMDVISYRDIGACNFLSASINATWNTPGANATGTLGDPSLDAYVSGNIGSGLASLGVTQLFSGSEDLRMDVTSLVSATVAGILPDNGFRLSYAASHEIDEKNYFVKRFSSRHVSNPRNRPSLDVLYDDSIQDQISDLYFDTTNTVYLYNNVRGAYMNIRSGTSEIQGNNCLMLSLAPVTASVTSSYSLAVTGSQYKIGNVYQDGVYLATFNPSSIAVSALLGEYGVAQKFKPVWKSLDGNVVYVTGAPVKVKKIVPTFSNSPEKRYVLNLTNLRESYFATEISRIRVYVQDFSTMFSVSKLPTPSKSLIFQNMYYRIKDSYKQTEIIPFETLYDATKLSTDADGMYFDLHMSDFEPDFVYQIEILLMDKGSGQIFGEQNEYLFKVLK